MSAITRFLFGDKDQNIQQTLLDQGQQNLQNNVTQGLQGGGVYGQGAQSYNAGQGYLNNLYSQSPDAFARLSDPYMRQFNQQVVPGLAERFSAAGEGGRHSSGFNQAIGAAGANLSSQLASMFENLRSQNLGQALNYAQLPFQQAQSAIGNRTFENQYQPGNTGFLGQAVGGLAGGAGNLAGLMAVLRMFGLGGAGGGGRGGFGGGGF